MKLRARPLTLKQANDLIARWHRHHKPVSGHRFSIAVVDEYNDFHGAAVAARPVARNSPQYDWLEVTRLVTDGTKNACSFLYSRCARIAAEMGFIKIQSFILDYESGVSLKASGWVFERMAGGGSWDRPRQNRRRRTDQPLNPKQLWSKTLNNFKDYSEQVKLL